MSPDPAFFGEGPAGPIDGACSPEAATVLIVEDDPSVVRLLEVNLRLEGYRVVVARDGAEALRAAETERPELVILDVMMPGGVDGFDVCRRLRSTCDRDRLSIIMLTARRSTADHLRGFQEGADDYVDKPFDPEELLGRVSAALRRARDLRAVNPLTGLPGNVQIERELLRRVNAGEPVALLHADLDYFKAYNDRYGFLRGDAALRMTGRLLSTVAERFTGSFVGHIGGDDFAIVLPAMHAEQFCALALDAFDACVRQLYDAEDVRVGGIRVAARTGKLMVYPFLSLSIGGATNARRRASHRELTALASEMKAAAKRCPGSAYAVDRRTGHPVDGMSKLAGHSADGMSKLAGHSANGMSKLTGRASIDSSASRSEAPTPESPRQPSEARQPDGASRRP